MSRTSWACMSIHFAKKTVLTSVIIASSTKQPIRSRALVTQHIYYRTNESDSHEAGHRFRVGFQWMGGK